MHKILDKRPAESSLYDDRAYTDYNLEDELFNKYGVLLKTQRKNNSKRLDIKANSEKKTQICICERIEITISDIKKMFCRIIHTVILKGFLLKVIVYMFANQLNMML